MTHDDFYWATFIWKNALQTSFMTLTWGFDVHSITTISRGTEFHCLGRKMHGKVQIQHAGWTNTFKITIIPDFEETPIVIENVTLEKIVSTIDDSIKHYYECKNAGSDTLPDVA